MALLRASFPALELVGTCGLSCPTQVLFEVCPPALPPSSFMVLLCEFFLSLFLLPAMEIHEQRQCLDHYNGFKYKRITLTFY